MKPETPPGTGPDWATTPGFLPDRLSVRQAHGEPAVGARNMSSLTRLYRHRRPLKARFVSDSKVIPMGNRAEQQRGVGQCLQMCPLRYTASSECYLMKTGSV